MNRMDRVEPNSGSDVGKQQTFHLGKVYITNPLVVILGMVYYWVCHTIGKVSYFLLVIQQIQAMNNTIVYFPGLKNSNSPL